MRITKRVLAVYPELTLFSNDAERIQALKMCSKKMKLMRRPLCWLFAIGCGMLVAAVTQLVSRVAIKWSVFGNFEWEMVRIIPATILGAGFGLGFHYFYRKPI